MQGNSNYKPYFCIEYKDYVPVSSVTLFKSSLGLMEGQTYTFYPTVTPGDATNQEFTWSSSNTAVATVSSSGKVTAKSVGTATITVRSKLDSSVTPARCIVIVGEKDSDYDGIIDSKDGNKSNNEFTVKWDDNAYESTNPLYNVSYQMDYSQFFTSNKEYNQTISTVSSLFAATVYDGQYITKYGITLNKDKKTKCGIKNFMEYHGMSDVVVEQLTVDEYKDQHITDVAIGHRRVMCGGIAKEIIAISVRGTNKSTEEWSSNFDIGCDDIFYNDSPIPKNEDWKKAKNHMGFDITANRVKKLIDEYISENIGSNSAIQKTLWITGHSRGGGIANILGAYYDSDYETFVYTFASPRTAVVSDAEAKFHNSIFNIVNTDDIISDLPLEEGWKFKRYGTDVGKSIQELYKAEWKKYTGTDYVSNTTEKDNLVNAFGGLAADRNDCYTYHCSCHGDGKDNNISFKSTDKTDEVIYGEPYQRISKRIITQTTIYEYTHCQTTAFFMQYLARLASAENDIVKVATVFTNLAGKYSSVKDGFVNYSAFPLGGGKITHPHQQISYYVLSTKNLKEL